jgi:hypothetical protein
MLRAMTDALFFAGMMTERYGCAGLIFLVSFRSVAP